MARSRGLMRSVLATAAALTLVAVAAPLTAQTGWRGLGITGGFSVEGYRGNLAAVTVPLVDSTDRAAAATGEFAGSGQYVFLESANRFLGISLDAGMRQFAATGFEVRDYAPREWVGSVALGLRQDISWASLQGNVQARGRSVTDRPPIPLYIQPASGGVSGALSLFLEPLRDVRFDAEVSAEVADYTSNDFAPLLDLLDRTGRGFEVGAAWGRDWNVRFFTGLRSTTYQQQPTFDENDPSRRDRTYRLGAEWESLGEDVWVQMGVTGTFNRSNSRRPEYDAVSVSGLVSVPLPWQLDANLYGVVTAKSYLTTRRFASLVPGEEADNASVLYLSLRRPVRSNLDASLRLGWTRAETDLGDSYFRRYGMGMFLHYRP